MTNSNKTGSTDVFEYITTAKTIEAIQSTINSILQKQRIS
mgnify:CR=1 FL=1